MSNIQDPRSTGLADKANKATINALRVNRKALGVAVAGVLVSIVGVVVGCGSGGVVVGGTSNSPSNCGVVGEAASCTVNNYETVFAEAKAQASNDSELKQRLRQAPSATQSPAGPGPWPFAVVDTGDLGLFARTTADAEATRVGNVANLTMVWADCLATSTFTPADVSGENNVGPKWAKVRWKHLGGGTERGLSEPTETRTAFMYRGALQPVGHNGSIPDC